MKSRSREYFKGKKKPWSHPSVIALMKCALKGEEPEDVIRRLADNKIAEAQQIGWSGPPFCPEELASISGIKIKPTEEDIGAEARILPVGDQVFIHYNPRKPKTRINFSICHELVHTFFPDCYEYVRHRSKDDFNWELECLCDLGAAELLMPRNSFQKDLENESTSLIGARNLSAKYQASSEAILIRLAQLSNSACATVFFSQKHKPTELKASQTREFIFVDPLPAKMRVDYVKPSSTFNIFIPKDKSTPIDSVVNRCLDSLEIHENVEQWDIQGFGKWRIQAAELPRRSDSVRRAVAIVFA
jgi:Zn-dependent peptidase ImmA (M78 family)